MAPVKRKIVLTKETTDTKIQKRPRTKTCRKKNENSTTTLLEELASEAVSSSQVEAKFSQKEYEEREKEKNEVDDDGERAKEVDEEEGNKREVEEDKGKQKEVEEEEGKNKEVVEEEEEKINEVDEDKGKQKEPNATGDSIMTSAMGKPFDTSGLPSSKMDIEAFNNYPWGHESFELTVKYLLKHLGPKTNNLFGFPWAFMAWAFEAIPYLTHQVNVEEEISCPTILRWLRSKTKTAKNILDLYNPPHDAVVHPWLVPTEKELQMAYLITLGLVETLFDPVVDRVKMELTGARTIKRDRVVNELVVFDGVDGRGIDVGAGVGQDQGAISCRRCSRFLCEKGWAKVIPSTNVWNPYTPQAKRRKKSFIKAIQNLKKKIFGELPMAVGEEVLEFKHVNVYKRVTIAEKNKLVDLTRAKELRAQYGMHFFSGEDFRTMTSMDIWWEDWYVDEIISLMRERHVRYPEYYDSTDRILDLNFYFNFKLRYDKMSEEATTVGGRSFTQLINEFEWDEDMINYVRGHYTILGLQPH
ncbi:hypothetical protein KY290_001072 [Solanum tuberosum]|uniref:Uncharacterized protein n=1 Tax=Solanum tuberosum TaxID=4113 RepID=A0ABQ7WL85_SOLTU|nr:hypothetical protein KY290_001072 [Solanum tuberosum]